MGLFTKIALKLFDDYASAYSSVDKGLDKADSSGLEKKYGLKPPPKLTDLNSFRNTEVFKNASKNVEREVASKLGPSTNNFSIAPDRKVVDDAAAQSIDGDVYGSFASSDIWEEIGTVEDSDKYSIGQQLYYLLPLFANPNYVISDAHFNTINEYFYVTDYNIPLGKTLDDTDAHKLSQFNIIKNEMAIATQHKADKNGRSKS